MFWLTPKYDTKKVQMVVAGGVDSSSSYGDLKATVCDKYTVLKMMWMSGQW